MKTAELQGAALDWAVAKCEGATNLWYDTVATHWITLDGKDRALRSGWAQSYLPSTDWSQGGPIIERENICLTHPKYDCWTAIGQDSTDLDAPLYQEDGPTPLIAAMRCFVSSKLGDEVEIPKELI